MASTMAAQTGVDAAPRKSSPQADAGRAKALVVQHCGFVWRSLRRLGVSESDAEDATQEVFVVAARRLDQIEPGREQSFLFGTAVRIASRYHRTRRRKPEVTDEDIDRSPESGPGPDELLDLAQGKEALYRLLDGMDLKHRAVFVLFEIEGMTMAEIATVLGANAGTVASRLRVAREKFAALVRQFETNRLAEERET